MNEDCRNCCGFECVYVNCNTVLYAFILMILSRLSDFVLRPSFEANRGNKMTGGCALPYNGVQTYSRKIFLLSVSVICNLTRLYPSTVLTKRFSCVSRVSPRQMTFCLAASEPQSLLIALHRIGKLNEERSADQRRSVNGICLTLYVDNLLLRPSRAFLACDATFRRNSRAERV